MTTGQQQTPQIPHTTTTNKTTVFVVVTTTTHGAVRRVLRVATV
jgi:hypothetical protein